jgi:hypothetical protein
VAAGFDGDLELGADAVRCGDQDRIGIARLTEIEQGAKSAQSRRRAGPCGGLGERLDGLDQGSAGVDVDSGLTIGLPGWAASLGNGFLVYAIVLW